MLIKYLILGTKIKERGGFEPPEPWDSSDFKSDAIDQLCHLSKICFLITIRYSYL